MKLEDKVTKYYDDLYRKLEILSMVSKANLFVTCIRRLLEILVVTVFEG